VIAITIDLEWSPAPLIADTLALLDDAGIRATLFSTHDDGFDVEAYGHERALHPNFQRSDQTEQEAFDELHALYPAAQGIRSHRMYCHTPLRAMYAERGITYESNYMMDRVAGIEPFAMAGGVVQFPVYFMDDVWLRSVAPGESASIDVETLLAPDGWKVFDFHPPHIYYNTPSIAHYQQHKAAYWADPDARLRSRGPGVRDLFIELIDRVDGPVLLGDAMSDIPEGQG
jgi:hypothetical protein